MKKKQIEINHCNDQNPKTVTLEYGSKKGFVCEVCNKFLEIDYDGNITESPLKECDIETENRRNVCTGFGGQLGGFKYRVNNGKIKTKGDIYK